MRHDFFKTKKLKISNSRWKIIKSMFLSLMITGAVIEFSEVGAGFVDGIVVSRVLGPEYMAAEGIAHPIFSIIGVISGVIATGMQVKCSQLIGRGKVKDVNRFFSSAVFVGLAASLVTSALVIVFAKPLAVALGASGNGKDLAVPASQYLMGIGTGIPALVMIAIIAPALSIDSGGRLVRIGAIAEAVIDVVLDIVAVKLGLGLFGVAVATSIACYIDLFIVCTHFLKKERMLHIVKPKIKAKDFVSMLSNGIEKALKRLANVLRPIVLNAILIYYGGTFAMSALSVRNNFSNFTEIIASGMAMAVSLLAGMYFGEANSEAINEVKRCEWRYALIFSGGICAVMLILSKPIASIYIKEAGETRDMVVFAIRMLALQNPLQTLIKSRISYLQAVSKKVNMGLLIFASQLIIIIASAFVMGKLFGAYGILSCFTVSDLISLMIVYVFYQFKVKKFLIKGSDLLALPDEFSHAPGDVISLDIRDMQDVVIVSEQIKLFCKGHKFNSRTGYYAALTFEELASNIVQHGFPENKNKSPIIDFRLVAMKDKLIMCIRDDCPHFDITKQIAKANADDADPYSNLGIRITSKTAKNIKYTRVFKTNSIIITYEV